jgi:hypothetical protein
LTCRVSSAISALSLGFTLLGAISLAHAATCTAGSGSVLDNTLFASVGLNPAAGGCTVNTSTTGWQRHDVVMVVVPASASPCAVLQTGERRLDQQRSGRENG